MRLSVLLFIVYVDNKCSYGLKGLQQLSVRILLDVTWNELTQAFALVFTSVWDHLPSWIFMAHSYFFQVFVQMLPFWWKLLWQSCLKLQSHWTLITLWSFLNFFKALITTWYSTQDPRGQEFLFTAVSSEPRILYST